MTEPIEERLKVAHYYYRENLSTAEIAAKLSLPQTRVQRLLREAVENGLVKISIPDFDLSLSALETELETFLGLKEVIIAEVPEHGELLDALAGAGNRALQKLLRDGATLGLSHGRSVATLVARMLPTDRWQGLTVTRLVGALGNTTLTIPSDDIARLCADKLGANINLLFAPIILKNAHLRRALMDEPLLQDAFRVISSTDIAVLGIGDVAFDSNSLLRESLNPEDYAVLTSSGAVGEICTHYFDVEGKSVSGPLGRHAVAIGERDLKSIPIRMGLAGGPEKTDAILGACRGRYINVLVTDRETAGALIRKKEPNHEPTL